MSAESIQIVSTSSGMYRYPASHWEDLSRYMVGDEHDPRNMFCLADDVWDAWVYADNGYPSRKSKYRFHFAHLRSFLKPYVKWYAYQRLLGKGGSLVSNGISLPYRLSLADSFFIEHDFTSLDDIASPNVFNALWEAHLDPLKNDQEIRSPNQVRRQVATLSFWMHIRANFGVPMSIPSVAPYKKRHPTEIAIDDHQVIPIAVIKQLVNKLALHREGKALLNRYHHLRLCVLLLDLASGRRIDEILAAPRGKGEHGPIARYPARGGSPEGALWFQFSPNKGGLVIKSILARSGRRWYNIASKSFFAIVMRFVNMPHRVNASCLF